MFVWPWLSFHQIDQTARGRKNSKVMGGSVRERTSHVVQKLILVSEHRGGSDDSSIGEGFLYDNLALSLGPVEHRSGIQRRVQVRNMNEF